MSPDSGITEPSNLRESQKFEKIDDIVIRIAGYSQDGIQAVGEVLAIYSGRTEYGVITFQTYPATISGGESLFQLRISKNPQSAGDYADILVVFYQDSFEHNRDFLRKGGILIFDTEHVKVSKEDRKEFRCIGVPIAQRTIEALGGSGGRIQKGKNMFLLGLLGHILSLDNDLLEDQINEKFSHKSKEVINNAKRAYHAGLAYEIGELKRLIKLTSPESRKRGMVTMNGNHALAMGAIAAGVRFGAAYPITPFSSIMEVLRAQFPKFGGMFIQCEDEISAIGTALGASFSGRVALTGTSGPGLSLKTEMLGLACMAEIGIVIIDVMRGGPSTGQPTKTEQSDFNHAVFGGHGDAPRIVLAPCTTEDCFYTMIEAVNAAKEYNMPVIILTDANLGMRVESFEMPALEGVMQDITPDLTPIEFFTPYPLRRDGLNNRAFPGQVIKNGKYPTITGLEHDEYGQPSGSPYYHVEMIAKRRRKLLTYQKQLQKPVYRKDGVWRTGGITGEIEGEILLVSWGSTHGPVEEIMYQLLDSGIKTGQLHIKHLHPLKPGLDEIFAKFDKIYVCELNDGSIYNDLGQFGSYLQMNFPSFKFRGITKTDGLAFKVSDIYDRLPDKYRAKIKST
ncbi:MAG: 2-oxoacid:acceptor oxidoreductase subunit alpha [Planctomycetes bacterium]|nr:2-oxoacid:acceptor oxidoreductase subunit alpha [Planctomycetota bacterium]